MCVCVRSKGKAKKTKEIRTSARPNLQKMWRVDRTFFLEGGLNLEQVLGLAQRKCGERGEIGIADFS